MIEQLPEIQRLTTGEKFQLATELWDELSTLSDGEPDAQIVSLLQQRHADFKAGLHPAAPWSEVKKRLGK